MKRVCRAVEPLGRKVTTAGFRVLENRPRKSDGGSTTSTMRTLTFGNHYLFTNLFQRSLP